MRCRGEAARTRPDLLHASTDRHALHDKFLCADCLGSCAPRRLRVACGIAKVTRATCLVRPCQTQSTESLHPRAASNPRHARDRLVHGNPALLLDNRSHLDGLAPTVTIAWVPDNVRTSAVRRSEASKPIRHSTTASIAVPVAANIT